MKVLSPSSFPQLECQLFLDSHVLIWYVTYDDGVAHLDLATDLTRHQKSVNSVRWSPSGEFLASCDDESVIFVWRQKPDSESVNICDRDEMSDADKETWLIHKTLRGHMEDVYDLSWSSDSQFLLSGAIDNTAIVWDVSKGKSQTIITEHKGFVQGVAWDPLNKYFATLCTDRFLRIFDAQSRKNVLRSNKSKLPVPKESPLYDQSVRLFHDDTLQTFFRRLCFSPEGSLIVVPSGVIDVEGSSSKPVNTTYIYTRCSLKE
jgi:chromatin assembly factor 1 subunit B